MKRLATTALLVAGICAVCALPAHSQRSGGHAGFAGHSSGGGFQGSGGFHSAPSASAHGGPVRSSGFAGVHSRAQMPSYRRAATGNALARPGNPDHRRHRQPYYSPYHTRYPYLLAPYYGYLGTGYLGDSEDSGASDSMQADNGVPYDAPPPEPEQQAFRPPYGVMPQQSASPAQQAQEAVTLVFKDGRPSEQIHNYILTPTTLYVQDQQSRAIPTSQLDLEATAKVNLDAGVKFQLPNIAR